MPDINYKDLEGFEMLGTHSEPHRGEMSHICDITVLRVNINNYYSHYFKNVHVFAHKLYYYAYDFNVASSFLFNK